jgi:hypothetical protein
MFFKDTYSQIAARFKAWLQNDNSNDFVQDLALDYLNQAKDSLLGRPVRGWDYLTVDYVPLALGGSTGLEITFPAEAQKIIAIYTDPSGIRKPAIFYVKDGRAPNGGEFISVFNKASGFVWSFKFYYQPTGAIYVRYQKALEDFTGTETEYSPFPGELLLLEAQRIRCRDKGLTPEWKMLKEDYDEKLKNFTMQHQGNNEDAYIENLDANGLQINIPEYTLSSGTKQRQMFGRRNDLDYRRD